jgi:two-component system, NarL family, invasion response regulator UvrY
VKRILIVDDHAVVRQGLTQILREAMPKAVFGEAEDGATALSRIRRDAWDVILLDISLPDANGLEVLKSLREASPNVPVLVLSMHAEEQFGIRALRGGAAGYVTKKSASHEIVRAVRRVLAGRRYVSESLAECLAVEVGRASEKLPHERLSNREYEIFGLLARGYTVKEISGRLRVSAQTVSTHRSRVLEKTGMSSNAELVQYGMRYQLFG